MDIQKIFKQLKTISPDPGYTKKSRFLIVGEPRTTASQPWHQGFDLRGDTAHSSPLSAYSAEAASAAKAGQAELPVVRGEEKSAAPAFRLPAFTARGFIASILKSGSAIALSAALVLMLVGSFSLWKFFAPQSTALLDPASLRAEAQAIDIQIQLTDIAYREPNLSNETSSPAIAPKTSGKPQEIANEARNEAEQLGLVAPTSSVSRISVDEALDKLSQ